MTLTIGGSSSAGGKDSFTSNTQLGNYVNTHEYSELCWGYGYTNAHYNYEVRTTSFNAYLTVPTHIENRAWNLADCAYYTSGHYWKTAGRNQNFATGLSAPFISLRSEASFSSDTTIEWNPSSAGEELCGSDDYWVRSRSICWRRGVPGQWLWCCRYSGRHRRRRRRHHRRHGSGLLTLRRVPVWLALAGGLSLSIAACSSGSHSHYSGPRLEAVENGSIGAAVTVRRGEPYVFPFPALCTSGGSVSVTKVVPAGPTGGMRVVDWGIRYRYPGDSYGDDPGAVPGLVSHIRGFTATRPVTVECTSTTHADQFSVSLATPTALGHIAGVWVYYGAGQRAFAAYDFTLCTTKQCPPKTTSD